MTHKEYDMKLWKTAFMGQIMQCVIVGGIHYKWGTVMPLVMSVIMALINAPSNPLVRLHIFGEDPSGLSPDKAAEITRPFSPAKSPFGSMMAGMQQQNQGETAEEERVSRQTNSREAILFLRRDPFSGMRSIIIVTHLLLRCLE